MSSAIIAGSTGLIGSELLKLLLANNRIEKITLLLRRDTNFNHPKIEKLIVDYDTLHQYANELKADIVFSCLGTTKAKTPDKLEYFKIEHDYPKQLAELCKENGATQFHYISALGADPKSASQYTRFKGMAENILRGTGMQSLYVYRPSILIGKRAESRVTEKIGASVMKAFQPFLRGSIRKFRAIKASDVARAMVINALHASPGIHVLESDGIQQLADGV